MRYRIIFYYIISQGMSKSDELALLRTYNQKLEDENQAKTNEIKILRQQLDTSSTTTKIISSSSNISSTMAICPSCKNKDYQIANLNKTIKELKDVYEKQVQRTVSPQIVKQTVFKDAHSTELQSIKKAFEQLKVKYDEVQGVKWTALNVDSQSIKQVQNLKQENAILRIHIQQLEKRLSGLQHSTKILREQTITHLHNIQPIMHSPTTYLSHVQSLQPSTSVTYLSSAPPQIIRTSPIIESPLQITIAEPNPLTNSPSEQDSTPTFKLYHGQNLREQHLSSIHYPHSYMEVAQPNYYHVFPPSNSQQYYSYSHVSSPNDKILDSTYSSELEADIFQEKWNSLRHKIALLEKENGRLRSEVKTVHY